MATEPSSQVRISSASRNNQNMSVSHYANETSTDFTSPMKQRTGFTSKESKVEIGRGKKMSIHATMQASPGGHKMIDATLPHVARIHGQSNNEI